MAKGKEKTGKKPVSNVRKLLEMKKTAEAGKHVTPAEKKAAASAMTQAAWIDWSMSWRSTRWRASGSASPKLRKA